MFTINTKSSIPIFEQIITQIGKFIALDVLSPDEQLPTVRKLARDLGINPNTVAKAYNQSEQQGMIYSIAGSGFFVAKTLSSNPIVDDAYKALADVYDNLVELGESPDAIRAFLERKIL